MPVADPQLTGLDWEPRVPEDGEKVRFRVTYTDLACRVPDRVSLRVTPEGGSPESYQMSLVEGEVETGATYEVEWSFPAGTYSIVVRATVGSIEKDSSQTTLIVEEKEEDDGLPWTLIIAAVAAAVIVALIIVRTRRRTVAKKAAKEGTAGIEVVEASVMGEEAFQEVEVAQVAAAAAPPREVPPHIAGAEAPATAEGAAVGPAAPPQVPMGVPTVPVRPPTPGATPARLQLPELPEEVPETPEAPTQAIETDVVDTGRLLIAPCPSCGSRLVIPRERPADVRCQKCGDEFTIN